MGLALAVGSLADLAGNDLEGFEYFENSMMAVNKVLQAAGLPPHGEPRDCVVWDAEMFGYSGLHYLRRIAAHLDCGRPLPAPGDDQAPEDPVLRAYYEGLDPPPPPGLLRRLFGGAQRFNGGFDHLLTHSDAEGFYLPQDFQRVLVAPEGSEVAGGLIGSVPRLKAELDRLVEVFAIPSGLHAGSDELWEAADSQGHGDALWQQYGIESYSCVVLREACEQSIETGAAIAFT